MPIELDYMEYADDPVAQAAYVSSDIYSADICNGGVVSACCYYGTDTPAKAFDNNNATRWRSNINGTHWLKYDLGAGNAEAVQRFTLYAPYLSETGRASMGNYVLAGSNNNSTWYTVTTGYADWDRKTFTASFKNLTAYRYYRITVDSDAPDNRVAIGEMQMMKKHLECYSESTIKMQGSYSLKILAEATNSLNDTLTRTVSPTIDLSDLTKIKLNVQASRIGSNLKVKIRDSGGTWSEYTIAVISADAWETKEWDISGISNANKDVIDRIQFQIINADADNTFYLDNMFANWWSKIFTEQIVLSDSFSRTWSIHRTFSETLHLADTIIVFRMFHRIFTETIVLSDSLKKKVGKVFTENITLADTLKKRVSKIFSETLTLSDTVSKKIAKTFTETLHLTDTFSRIWHIYRTFTEKITLADTLRKKIGKTFIESLTLADTLVKRAIRQRANLLQALESDAMFPSGVVRNLQHGAEADLSALSPVRGDWYIAIDTQKVYACFIDGSWVQIYP